MIDQGRPGRAIAQHQLRQTFGRIGAKFARHLVEQRLHRDRGQRRLFGRLPHDAVTANQGKRGIPGPDRDGEVERGDDRDRAQRMPGFAHAMARALAGDGQAMQLARQTHGEIADIDHLLHFAQPLGQWLAAIERDQQAQLGLACAQRLTETPDKFSPARRRYRTPMGKSRQGAIRDKADLIRRGGRKAADRHSVYRAEYLAITFRNGHTKSGVNISNINFARVHLVL